jgi:hypothetical protein
MQTIKSNFLGEMPLGNSVYLQTNHSKIRWLIYTCDRISLISHVYGAVWSALLAIRNINEGIFHLFFNHSDCCVITKILIENKEKPELRIQSFASRAFWDAASHFEVARQSFIAFHNLTNPPNSSKEYVAAKYGSFLPVDIEITTEELQIFFLDQLMKGNYGKHKNRT